MKAAKPKVVSRQNCTENWLSQRFDQLLKLDLIELDDDFYEDALYFKESDALDEKFTQLEEDNLFYIHRIQDIEQYLESTQETISRTHENLDRNVTALHENKDNLTVKILEAQSNLETYQKSSIGNKIQD